MAAHRLSRLPAAPAAELAKLIQELFEPESWQEPGGQCIIRALAGRLIVRHRARVHDHIQRLLAVLGWGQGMGMGGFGMPFEQATPQGR